MADKRQHVEGAKLGKLENVVEPDLMVIGSFGVGWKPQLLL